MLKYFIPLLCCLFHFAVAEYLVYDGKCIVDPDIPQADGPERNYILQENGIEQQSITQQDKSSQQGMSFSQQTGSFTQQDMSMPDQGSMDGCCPSFCPCPITLCGLSRFSGARLDAGYAVGRWIGIRHNYAEFGLFLPLVTTDNAVVFGDGRGYRFDNNKWGASGGMGVRTMTCCCEVVGFNIYYDYLRVQCRKNFNRVGFGLEWLSECFDARLNAYFPVGRRKICRFDCESLCCISVIKEESIGNGFDAEIGIPFFCCDNLSVYAAIGPYYYEHKSIANYWGGMARLELDWTDFLTIELKGSYDRRNHARGLAKFQLNLPLDFLFNSCDCMCPDILCQPVKRNGIIFTRERCECD